MYKRQELSLQLETDDKLRNYVISSMTYPIILLVVSVLSVTLLLAFVVPQFREIFDSMGDALPYSTCLLYTSAAADERSSVDLGGGRIIKKKKKNIE